MDLLFNTQANGPSSGSEDSSSFDKNQLLFSSSKNVKASP